MNSVEIRQSFLDFFAAKEHEIVPSAPLMPSSPNLLFTNAGMNQFVPYFLGERPAPYSRAADTQKCIRAGGKHNDLEDVGFDTYHHTFFEMLGNWSFGDYFKKEAIEWSWELLTKVWGFPKARLYATVYQPDKGDPSEFDQEAYDCWKAIFEREGLDPKIHIRYGGKKDNFWMMGDTGPCGPCSELHMDLTLSGQTHGKLVNADSPYCIEIWNLVFIQFNAEANGTFAPLKSRHVDTGMGFERVAGIMASTDGFNDFSRPPSNYDSDLFQDIFKHISDMSGHTYRGTVPEYRDDLSGEEMNDVIFRVLADHIRTLSFSIADGILPGNEGRNYVLRRILRRAVMFGKRLDLKPGFFARLVDPLVNKMSPHFPELKAQRDVILKVISNEEKAFDRTLDRGLQLLDKITLNAKSGTIAGEEAFILYDTYGFPLDLTELIARERGLTVDSTAFEAEMEKQRARARAAHQQEIISVTDGDRKLHSTQFVGYDSQNLTEVESELLAALQGEDASYLIFAQTPLYAEMGGQIGDYGTINLDGNIIQVQDTLTDEVGHYLHKVEKSEIYAKWVGKTAALSVDLERRAAIQRHHSATHIMNWALRTVLGNHIRQNGSLVTPNHLRFDFTHFEALKPEQLNRIEELVNRKILENSQVHWFEVPFNDKPNDVIAVFGEKYGSVVRVVDIGGFSKELCGGTHVRATGEIGLFKILHETAVAAGVRRIEAVVGESAFRHASETFQNLHKLALKLSCQPAEVEERILHLMEQRHGLEKRLRAMEQKNAASQGDRILDQAVENNGIHILSTTVTVANPNDLRGLAASLGKKLGPSVVILGAAFDDKATVVAICSPEAIEKGYQAGNIVRELADRLDGKGGGKPDFAMGGGKDVTGLPKVLQAFKPGP